MDESSNAPAESSSPNPGRYLITAVLLIVCVSVLRVFYLAWWGPLDLANDEAHYWDWSRHLDWCYYSKGPLVAWLIRASCTCFGDTMVAVRLPAVICGGLLSLGLYVLTVQIHGSVRLGLATLVLSLTFPLLAAGSSLMTIDSPFTCAWMWALVFAHRAAFRGAAWYWGAAGMCIMVGLLAKHTMVLFVPFLGLFFLTTPSLRHHLAGFGFWVMAGIGALGAAPILGWNAANGWVTFKHTQGHAGLHDDVFIHWLGPLHFLGAQFALLLGFWFIALARAVWQHRPWCESRPELSYLWWMSAPIFLFFWLFSWKNGAGGANWPAPAYLAGMVLMAGWLRRELRDPRPGYRRAMYACVAAAAVLGVVLVTMLHVPALATPVLSRTELVTVNNVTHKRISDPTTRLRGWRHLASEVDIIRANLRERGIDPVLLGQRWTQTGELAFYCKDHPTVHTVGLVFQDRTSQCDLWRPNPVADPDVYLGRSFVVVNIEPERMQAFFDSIEPTRTIEYWERGRLIAYWPITIGHGFRGFGESTARRDY